MATDGKIAVIDIGKTNAKVVLVDSKTMAEIAFEKVRNDVVESGPYPHFNVDKIWDFILSSLRNFQATYSISAISITAHGACCALLDEDGNLASPILDYEHQAVDQTGLNYNKVRPSFAETGSPRLTGGLNLGAQIYWLFETVQGLKDRTDTILMYPQYWAHRLTGISANEVSSLGCHTDLWNPHNSDFSSMVDAMGWREKFAPLRPANNVLGSVSSVVAEETGLSIDTTVYCGIHDSNASLYPYLLSHKEPFSVVSTGTWVIVMSVGGTSANLDEERDTLINVNAAGNQVPSARFMGGREYEILCDGRECEFNDEDIHSVLANSIMLFPSVEMSSGPFRHKKMRWTHEAASMSDGEHSVVASFYLALMTLTCLDLVGAQGSIFVEGSFCQNKAYLSMLQAMVSGSVSRSDGTGTSLGAALLVVGSSQKTSSDPVRISSDHGDLMRTYGETWMKMVSRYNSEDLPS